MPLSCLGPWRLSCAPSTGRWRWPACGSSPDCRACAPCSDASRCAPRCWPSSRTSLCHFSCEPLRVSSLGICPYELRRLLARSRLAVIGVPLWNALGALLALDVAHAGELAQAGDDALEVLEVLDVDGE